MYRNTVDTVRADYTNITSAVLNSSLKDHATGMKRYLDGVATLDGLAGETSYYFWARRSSMSAATRRGRNRSGATCC
jgi:hypothetical protein